MRAKRFGWTMLLLSLRFVALAMVSTTFVGCEPYQRVGREAAIGSYRYVSYAAGSRASDHNLSRLVLHPDGTYVLAERGTTRAISSKTGVWHIETGTPETPDTLVLDRDGYPIEINGNEVRVLIEVDTRVWWAKAKDRRE